MLLQGDCSGSQSRAPAMSFPCWKVAHSGLHGTPAPGHGSTWRLAGNRPGFPGSAQGRPGPGRACRLCRGRTSMLSENSNTQRYYHSAGSPGWVTAYSKSVFERRIPWSLMCLFLTIPFTPKQSPNLVPNGCTDGDPMREDSSSFPWPPSSAPALSPAPPPAHATRSPCPVGEAQWAEGGPEAEGGWGRTVGGGQRHARWGPREGTSFPR